MSTNIIEISSHPNYKPIVSQMVLIIYNSWKPTSLNIDDWQKIEYQNALEVLRIANIETKST